MNPRFLACALLFPALALAQAPLPGKDEPKAPETKAPEKKAAEKKAPEKKAAAKPAAKGGPVATVNGVAIPQSRAEFLLQQQTSRGAPDNEQMRGMVRDELVNRELIAQEATKAGTQKTPEVQAQIEMARQEILVTAYLREWARKHPVSDADVQKEYDKARSQHGDKEYKARHILLETEEQAKSMIAQLKKGAKFEDLASKNSKDTGNASRGGDLDWNVPGTYDKQFSDAMTKLEKGKYTETPVQTRFGYHVIMVEDVRPAKFATLAEVKPRIQQMLVQGKIEELIRNLRAKAKIE